MRLAAIERPALPHVLPLSQYVQHLTTPIPPMGHRRQPYRAIQHPLGHRLLLIVVMTYINNDLSRLPHTIPKPFTKAAG